MHEHQANSPTQVDYTAAPPLGMVSVCGDLYTPLLGESPADTWNTDGHSSNACIYRYYHLAY